MCIDFCFGDTGAMNGHSPGATYAALQSPAEKGITHMLPAEDAIWVSDEPSADFGLKDRQFTLTASDTTEADVDYHSIIFREAGLVIFG